MLTRLLSNDFPRSRVLAVVLVLLLVALAFAPFLFPGVKALNVAAKVLVFVVLVASFDLLLGYTGIVSFAHTMFFGIGAYGVAIASTHMGAGWAALGTGIGIRGDFSYFVLRVDFGLPLRWPYRQEESGSYWALNRFTRLKWKDFNPNLAVGYPF